MKKIVLTYSLIAGAIMFAMMIIPTVFFSQNQLDSGKAEIIGYTTMIAAFLLIFFGVKNYRDNYSSGTITFWKAFLTGLYIMLIASVIYVIAWMIIQPLFMPDFYQKYFDLEAATLKANGATVAQLAEAKQNADSMIRLVSNPVFKFLLTLLEPLPVGLPITVISALVLKKKPAQA
ncbi:MAG TPA: DUF4199 domain-containing protein [Bacteroidia bacterium]|nr:DUF4199 domain-containing protein [Bacteroidia bacterium]